MLEQRDREVEGQPELAEQPAAASYPPPSCASRARKRRACASRYGGRVPGRNGLDRAEQLLDLGRLAERKRRLEGLDESLLARLGGDAERAPGLDRRLGVGERLPDLSFGAAQRGPRAQVGGALLEVDGMLDTREHLEEATGAVELAALDVDLDRRLEQAQQGSAGVDLLLGELRGGRLCVLPATEHEGGVRPLSQHRPLVRAAADLPRKRERLVEEPERLGIRVPLEAAVGEPEVAGAASAVRSCSSAISRARVRSAVASWL